MSEKTTAVADQDYPRLDIFLHEKFPETSRSMFQKLIREDFVKLEGNSCTPKSAVKTGETVQIEFPPPKPAELKPEKIPLSILFEDKHLLILDKPAGMVVHPGAGNFEHTLVQALLHHCKGQLSGIGGVERPGIVHRLDKDTSGCLIVAKTDAAHQALSSAFQEHSIQKYYLAVVKGNPKALSGRIDKPIGRNPVHRKKMSITDDGREAITEWKIHQPLKDLAVLQCKILTGRTHQIRVHLSSIGYPVLGDLLYGRASPTHPAARQMLHAWKLEFEHPITGKLIQAEAPIPKDMAKVFSQFKVKA
jgi:23S rRNA pseudouridine1911/1915/1917 synthase